MESAKRSRTARSSVQCTNRVAIFPRSETSIFFNRSSRSSNSYKRHFAASRCNWDIRSRTSAEVPGGTKRLSPRQPASPPVPGGKNPATKCRRSTPHQWKPGSPRSSRPARQWQTGPVVKVPVYRWTKGTLQIHCSGELRHGMPRRFFSSTRCNTRAYVNRAARFAVGVRRSRSRQISNLLGCACPSRCTSKRSTSFFTSASITRRTTLRSDDHKCSTHLLRSPEMEYLDCAKSNATAPSSITTAFRAPTRKSSTVLTRVSGFTSRFLQENIYSSVMSDHSLVWDNGIIVQQLFLLE